MYFFYLQLKKNVTHKLTQLLCTQNLPPTGLRYLIALDMTAAIASRRCFFERFVSVEDAAVLVALCIIKAEIESNIKLVTFMKPNEGTESIREIPICKMEESMETLKGKLSTVSV